MSRPLLLALLALAPVLWTAPAGGQPPCGVPEELLHYGAELRATKQRLRQDQPVKIVALGGGSSTGLPAGGAEFAWPARLQAALAARYPKSAIAVVNKSQAREAASQAVARIERDVLAEQPQLVVWETGTNDAVRGVDVEEFSRTVQSGIDLLRQNLVDVVVMDMQYSRQGSQTINVHPYLAALHGVADANDVMQFRRYEIMKFWSKTRVFAYDDVPRAERAQLAAKVYDCLGRRLAEAIELALR